MGLLKTITPIKSYFNPYEERILIFKENKNKAGIYVWTNLISSKSYVGSSNNLTLRFNSYLNKSRLEREITKNGSIIYRALLKYNYKFRLDIIEYCSVESLIEREQFFLDNWDFKYNILKVAKSLLGFKHSFSSIERMRKAKLGKTVSEKTKLKLSATYRAFPLIVTNLITNQIINLPSIRTTAKFLNLHHSYLAKCLKNNNYYKNKVYYVTLVSKN
jgi:hypothetical protein